ncbi:MAG: hypothetical protein Q8N39_05730 [Pelolinea sp.]|nr:hypothetical protein [Pelolinea sp.]
MKSVIWAIFTVSLALNACARMPAARPDDFSLTLDWGTGALPPPFHYSYTIAIGPNLVGKFTYQPGYGPEDSVEIWKTDFNLESNDLDALYSTLAEKGMLCSSWSTGQPLLGGKSTSLIITASGKDYHVPSVSELTQSERDKVEAIIDTIRGYVPQAIWDEMNECQAEFEEGFEN